MSATDTRTAYQCPSWCVAVHDAERRAHYSAGRGVPGMDNIRLELGEVFADGSGGLRVIFADGPGEVLDLPINSARRLWGVLGEVLAEEQPAAPAVAAVVEAEAEARGITWGELAAVAGVVDASNLTVSDLTRMTMTLGQWEQRLAEHLLRVMEA